MTGAPCETVPLQGSAPQYPGDVDKDIIWAQLLSCKAHGFLMGASCGGGLVQIDEGEFQRVGLRPHHAYSVLDVQDIQGGIRLVRMRNPWGHTEWNGDWSDESDIWPDELRHMIIPNGKDDGDFWICYEDVIKYFDCIDICKVSCN